jgi:hypothetical protein
MLNNENMKHILAHHNTKQLTLLFIADSVFFSVTNPQKVASWLLIVGVLLLTASLYYVELGLLTAAKWYGLPSGKQPKRLAKVSVGILGCLMALQSIGELSSRDIWVLLPLGFVAYLYSYRVFVRPESQ